MAKYVVRMGFIFLMVIFDAGIGTLFSGGLYATSASAMLAVAWTISGDFVLMYAWIIVLGVFSDIFLFQPIGYASAVFVFLSYLTGFFSRRFLVQHVFWGNIALVFLILIVTFLYNIFHAIIFLFDWRNASFDTLFLFVYEQFSVRGLFGAFLVNSIFFSVLRRAVNFSERYIAFSQARVEPKRHR